MKINESQLINIIKRTLNESQLITEEKCNVRCKYSHDVCPDGDDSGAKSWNAHGSVGMYGSSNCSEFGYSACATHCGMPGMVTPDGGDEIKKLIKDILRESQLLNEEKPECCRRGGANAQHCCKILTGVCACKGSKYNHFDPVCCAQWGLNPNPDDGQVIFDPRTTLPMGPGGVKPFQVDDGITQRRNPNSGYKGYIKNEHMKNKLKL